MRSSGFVICGSGRRRGVERICPRSARSSRRFRRPCGTGLDIRGGRAAHHAAGGRTVRAANGQFRRARRGQFPQGLLPLAGKWSRAAMPQRGSRGAPLGTRRARVDTVNWRRSVSLRRSRPAVRHGVKRRGVSAGRRRCLVEINWRSKAARVHLGAADGPALRFLALPSDCPPRFDQRLAVRLDQRRRRSSTAAFCRRPRPTCSPLRLSNIEQQGRETPPMCLIDCSTGRPDAVGGPLSACLESTIFPPHVAPAADRLGSVRTVRAERAARPRSGRRRYPARHVARATLRRLTNYRAPVRHRAPTRRLRAAPRARDRAGARAHRDLTRGRGRAAKTATWAAGEEELRALDLSAPRGARAGRSLQRLAICSSAT